MFGGNLDLPKLRNWKKFCTISEPALKCENNCAIVNQNYFTLKLLFPSKYHILAVLAQGEI